MATLKDIAQQVGVSVSAVSLALRDHPSIGQETRKRIWDVKKKLGYELKSKSNGIIVSGAYDGAAHDAAIDRTRAPPKAPTVGACAASATTSLPVCHGM